MCDFPSFETPLEFLRSMIYLLLIGFALTWLIWRLNEKSYRWNAFSTGEDALNSRDLTGKIAIVTGCNRGIGKEMVRLMAKYGCKVIMACRNEEKANEAKNNIAEGLKLSTEQANERLIVMKLDLAFLESVKQFAMKFNSKQLKIDYLVNNAGVVKIPKYETSKDGFELQFATNHLGHFYLTHLLMPSLLRGSDEAALRTPLSYSNSDLSHTDVVHQNIRNFVQLPRIINISSMAIRHSRDYSSLLKLFDYCIKNTCFMGDKCNEYDAWVNYSISKCCNVLFTRELQSRFDNKLIAVCCHPGGVNTGLNRRVRGNNIFKSIKNFLMNPFIAIKNLKSVEQGAATALRCIAMLDVELKKGQYYMNCRTDRKESEITGVCRQDMNRFNDRTLQTKLWQLSQVLIESKGFSMEYEQNESNDN